MAAGCALVAVATALATVGMNLMSYPERLAPVAALAAGAGAACLAVGASICFHAAGD